MSKLLNEYAPHLKLSKEKAADILTSISKLISIDITFVTESYHEKEIDKLYTLSGESIKRLGVISEFRDEDTGRHVQRIAHYCKIISNHSGFDSIFQEKILESSPMHDIGKIGIPDKILLKPGGLDKAEFEIMKTHAAIGYEILKNSTSEVL